MSYAIPKGWVALDFLKILGVEVEKRTNVIC